MQSGSMQASKIKFKAGQVWKNRDGDIISIASIDNSTDYPVIGHDGRSWTENGSYLIGRRTRADLVEPICADNKYSVEEVITTLLKVSNYNLCVFIPDIKKHLSKTKDPEYKKYLELKAKFE